MKRLHLLRHAKSSWDAAVSRDFDRPLSKRGLKAGKLMGRYMLAERLRWDAALVSPAQRTVQTVARLEAGIGKALDPHYDERLYMASTTQLLQILRGLDDAIESVLIIAHNPGIQGLALALTPNDDGEETCRARIDAKYPTAALTVLDLDVPHWSAVAPGVGRLERFIKPKDLKRHDAADSA